MEGRGKSSRPVASVESASTKQVKVESCYMVPSSTLGEDGSPSSCKTGFDSRWDYQIVYLSRLG